MKHFAVKQAQPSLRFRRWSRKGYAAFISLQRAVTIGQLSTNVSERFQIKNQSLHTSVLPGKSKAAPEGEAAGEEKEKNGVAAYPCGIGQSDTGWAAQVIFFLVSTLKIQTAGTDGNSVCATGSFAASILTIANGLP